MPNRRQVLKAAVAGLASMPAARAAAAPEARAAADALVAAMGGAARWRSLASIMVAATHHELPRAVPHANRIWNDFNQPRVRFEARSALIDRVSVLNGNAGWQQRDGVLTLFEPKQVADETAWWDSNIYRTLHRLARGDPALSPRLADDGRLEIVRADGSRLNWFALNKAAEPIRFGTANLEGGTVMGPLGEADGIRFARWGTNSLGSWRYEITQVIANPPLPDALFAAPAPP